MMLPSNKLGYIKHMVVEHDMVMKYLERDLTLELALDKALVSVGKISLPATEEVQAGHMKDVVDKSDSDAN
jgi:hypothetical protein